MDEHILGIKPRRLNQTYNFDRIKNPINESNRRPISSSLIILSYKINENVLFKCQIGSKMVTYTHKRTKRSKISQFNQKLM